MIKRFMTQRFLTFSTKSHLSVSVNVLQILDIHHNIYAYYFLLPHIAHAQNHCSISHIITSGWLQKLYEFLSLDSQPPCPPPQETGIQHRFSKLQEIQSTVKDFHSHLCGSELQGTGITQQSFFYHHLVWRPEGLSEVSPLQVPLHVCQPKHR